MATIWKIFVDVFFPVAFTLIVLLNLPAPRSFRRGIVLLADKVLGFPLIGSFQLLHVVLVCTGGSFAETARQTLKLQQQRASEMVETPNVVTGLLAKKWRAERNFWLSFFCFTLWCMVASFYRLQVRMLHLEEDLQAARGDTAPRASKKKDAAPSAPPLDAGAAGGGSVQMSELKKSK